MTEYYPLPRLPIVTQMKTRCRMAWAVLRGHSVCFRMTVDSSPRPQTKGSFVVENHIGVDNGNGINMDAFVNRPSDYGTFTEIHRRVR